MRRNHLLLVLASFAAASVSVAAILFAADHFEEPVKVLTRDPYRAARAEWYAGYVSLAGSTIWMIGGLVALTTALVGRALLGCRLADPSAYRVLLLGGLLGTAMALDDILLFHDVYADYLRIPELAFHGCYGLSAAYLLLSSRRQLAATPWLLLLAALAGFATSSLVDLIMPTDTFWKQSEDVFKFCGIVLWSGYFLGVARDFVRDGAARTDAARTHDG